MNRGFFVLDNESHNIDIHVNCWRCFKDQKIMLDYGIMLNDLNNTSKFNKLVLFCPFEFTNKDVKCICDETIADRELIFNESLGIKIDGKNDFYTIITDEENVKDLWGMYSLRDSFRCIPLEEEEGTFLELTPKDGDIDKIKSLPKCYFRIRIIIDITKLSTIFIKKTLNDYFLKSSNDYREIISFRFNNVRDMSNPVDQYIKSNNLKFTDINSVRFFFIAGCEFDIHVSKDNSQYSMRLIENERWNNYLSNREISETTYCYYWKSEKLGGDNHYSFLFDIRNYECNFITILIYIVALIIINLLSNLIFQVLYDFLCNMQNENEICSFIVSRFYHFF